MWLQWIDYENPVGKQQTHAGLQTSQGLTSAHEAQLDELRISNPLDAEFESRRGYSLHFKLPFITFGMTLSYGVTVTHRILIPVF